MVPYVYYYAFSLILAIASIQWLANLIYLRVSSKTFFGQEYKKGSREHKGASKFANNKHITVSTIITAVLILNLVNSIVRTQSLATSDSQFISTLVTAFVGILSLAMFFIARNMYSGNVQK